MSTNAQPPRPQLVLGALYALLLSAFGVAHSAHAQARYSVTTIGAPESTASVPQRLNEQGSVAGYGSWLNPGSGYLDANGTYSTFGLAGYRIDSAYLNASGTVVGNAAAIGATVAYKYENGVATILSPTGTFGKVAGINDAGVIVGTSWQTPYESDAHAVYFANGQATRIEGFNGSPRAINNAGVVAGDIPGYSGSANAFTYANGVVTMITNELNESSFAWDINDRGDVVGVAGDWENYSHIHAYLWRDGTMIDLGALGSYSLAYGVNNLGQVVGFSSTARDDVAFLYTDGAMVDLNTLIDPALGFQMTAAYDINDRGQITARGCDLSGVCRAVRLDPLSAVPEPATYGMLLGGLGLLGFVARRRQRAAR